MSLLYLAWKKDGLSRVSRRYEDDNVISHLVISYDVNHFRINIQITKLGIERGPQYRRLFYFNSDKRVISIWYESLEKTAKIIGNLFDRGIVCFATGNKIHVLNVTSLTVVSDRVYELEYVPNNNICNIELSECGNLIVCSREKGDRAQLNLVNRKITILDDDV